jgi:hypothetical protein
MSLNNFNPTHQTLDPPSTVSSPSYCTVFLLVPFVMVMNDVSHSSSTTKADCDHHHVPLSLHPTSVTIYGPSHLTECAGNVAPLSLPPVASIFKYGHCHQVESET